MLTNVPIEILFAAVRQIFALGHEAYLDSFHFFHGILVHIFTVLLDVALTGLFHHGPTRLGLCPTRLLRFDEVSTFGRKLTDSLMQAFSHRLLVDVFGTKFSLIVIAWSVAQYRVSEDRQRNCNENAVAKFNHDKTLRALSERYRNRRSSG